jgi:hypothetical protein
VAAREGFPQLIEATLELRDYPYDHDHCLIDWAEFTNDPDPSHWHEGRETFLTAYRVRRRGPFGEMEDWDLSALREPIQGTLHVDPDSRGG